MRTRERKRIERRRAEFDAALAEYQRARRSVSATRDPRRKRKKLQTMLRAREEVSEARGRLQIALQAPARQKLRDITTRPGRYAQPQRAIVRAESELDSALQRSEELRQAALPANEARAERLLRDLFARGFRLEEAFRLVAGETGLSPAQVFTIGMYLVQEQPVFSG